MPAVGIITDPFISTAETIGKVQGMPGFPFVTMPHPITSLDDAGMRERAQSTVPKVLEILLSRA